MKQTQVNESHAVHFTIYKSFGHAFHYLASHSGKILVRFHIVVTWKHECAFIPIGCARSAALSMSQCSFLVSKTHLETKEETSMALDDMLLALINNEYFQK